jgi:outer membrane protein assembly factor BamE (lipoprotein component of BamABCDE complex)
MKIKIRFFRIITGIGITLLVSSCSVSTFGKFQADEGIPSFIQVGKTTREEIMTTLGEPLVHHFWSAKKRSFTIMNGENTFFSMELMKEMNW